MSRPESAQKSSSPPSFLITALRALRCPPPKYKVVTPSPARDHYGSTYGEHPAPTPSPNSWQGFGFAIHVITVAWSSLGVRTFPILIKQTIDHFFTINCRNCHSSSHITAHVTLSSLELNLPGSPWGLHFGTSHRPGSSKPWLMSAINLNSFQGESPHEDVWDSPESQLLQESNLIKVLTSPVMSWREVYKSKAKRDIYKLNNERKKINCSY